MCKVSQLSIVPLIQAGKTEGICIEAAAARVQRRACGNVRVNLRTAKFLDAAASSSLTPCQEINPDVINRVPGFH
jgi:hypothetical protein